jgi:hypothetical protein
VTNVKRVLEDLVGARNLRSATRAARLLSEEAQYWDCRRGDVTGREAVAAALTAQDARIEVETAAAAGPDAVLELQLDGSSGRYRSTEVYRFDGDAVASVKAYFDPALRA